MDSEWGSEDSEMEILQMQRGGCSSLQEDSDATSSDDEELMVDTAADEAEPAASVPVAKRKRLKPEKIRTRGQGALEGYFIKIDSESNEEDDYDFVSFPWVESLVARTRSIYADEKTISAFVDSRDVMDGNLPGNVECSWMMEDDQVCSRVPSAECRPFVLLHPNSWGFIRAFEILSKYFGIAPSTKKFFYFFQVKFSRPLGLIPINSRRKGKILIAYAQSFMYFKDHFFRLRSEEGVDFAALSAEELVEVKFFKEVPPLRCIKLIRLGDDPVKLKAFMDQMAPELDKKALVLEMKRQRLANAEKDKVGASLSAVAPELPHMIAT
ncbi:hypothetical protein SESBI_25126 [Sesbania bispinosa]|nr:hypothetical protein SESBI_25126 [Sesbania bispinosa]